MRGLDPRDHALLAYGGAGPLHAAEIAEELGMATVLVPPRPGNFSALGLLVADIRRDLVRTRVGTTAGDDAGRPARHARRVCARRPRRNWPAPASPSRRRRYEAVLDMRFTGQAFELAVPVPLRARRAWRRSSRPSAPSMPPATAPRRRASRRSSATASPPSARRRSPTCRASTGRPQHRGGAGGVPHRPSSPAARSRPRSSRATCCRRTRALPGPAIIEEDGSCTVVPPGWTLRLLPQDVLVLERD